MPTTTDIKKGTVIRQQNGLYSVVEFQHVSPGKGAAFVRTKMKNLSDGKVIEVTYKSGESIDMAEVNFQTMQFLYQSGDSYSFMNMDNYEQVEVGTDVVGDEAKYLKEGLKVVLGIYEENPVSIQIPKKIKYTVVEAPPAVKGNSAAGNVTKEVKLDNGLRVKAPIFIKEGEEILVNTETGDYSERAN
ncbi:MAG: elongation factor P [bacterium]